VFAQILSLPRRQLLNWSGRFVWDEPRGAGCLEAVGCYLPTLAGSARVALVPDRFRGPGFGSGIGETLLLTKQAPLSLVSEYRRFSESFFFPSRNSILYKKKPPNERKDETRKH